MSTITREQQRQILIETANHIISRENTSPHSENLRELARIALSSLTTEPDAQIKPAADLYALCWQPGDVVTYTPEPEKATIWLSNYAGTCVQEYVTLERLQEALAGNSPATPDCSCRTCRPVTFTDSRFVVCPECGNKRCPHANDHRNDCTGSNEPGQVGSAYPAAPQQEVQGE